MTSRALERRLSSLLAATYFFVPGSLAAADELNVAPPPPSLMELWPLKTFYKKHVSAGGFPILASEKVSDFALLEAAYLINQMLAGREDIRAALIKNKVRFTVMAATEMTTAVPEHSDLTPPQYWDRRARGLGATPKRPAVSCGEENLLGFPGDPYGTENILVHEFAHVIHEMGLNSMDPEFDRQLRTTYDQAMAAGLWKGKYAAQNRMEYWAEGVQSWFDTNRENDRDHNHVNTRPELKEYDPALARLIANVFGDGKWRYRKPADRPPDQTAHLRGYEPAKAPRFTWPAELLAWNEKYRQVGATNVAGLKELPIKRPVTHSIPASPPSEQKTSILFVNRRDQEVSLYWVDGDGQFEAYGQIRPGDTHPRETFTGHVFIVTANRGEVLAMVTAEDKPGKVIIE